MSSDISAAARQAVTTFTSITSAVGSATNVAKSRESILNLLDVIISSGVGDTTYNDFGFTFFGGNKVLTPMPYGSNDWTSNWNTLAVNVICHTLAGFTSVGDKNPNIDDTKVVQNITAWWTTHKSAYLSDSLIYLCFEQPDYPTLSNTATADLSSGLVSKSYKFTLPDLFRTSPSLPCVMFSVLNAISSDAATTVFNDWKADTLLAKFLPSANSNWDLSVFEPPFVHHYVTDHPFLPQVTAAVATNPSLVMNWIGEIASFNVFNS